MHPFSVDLSAQRKRFSLLDRQKKRRKRRVYFVALSVQNANMITGRRI
jgi:hypothetical protein